MLFFYVGNKVACFLSNVFQENLYDEVDKCLKTISKLRLEVY
jgi:hypothetical protein